MKNPFEKSDHHLSAFVIGWLKILDGLGQVLTFGRCWCHLHMNHTERVVRRRVRRMQEEREKNTKESLPPARDDSPHNITGPRPMTWDGPG